jgi:hypothetical protein
MMWMMMVMTKTCFSEKLVDFERNTKDNISEERNLQYLNCKNFKFNDEQPEFQKKILVKIFNCNKNLNLKIRESKCFRWKWKGGTKGIKLGAMW